MPSAKQTTEIDVTPEEMMRVITDFGSYSDFLPEIEDVEIVRESDSEWDVRFTVKVVKRLRYVLRLKQNGPHQLRWHLLEGAFKVNEGGWDLVPIDEGKRTHVTYFIDLQIGMFVPSSIMRNAVERTLPDTLKRFKGEAERQATS